MARRRKGGSPTVSLFPFLSILACVIGVLTLLITAIALGQLDPAELARIEQQLVEQRERAERFAEAQTKVNALDTEVRDAKRRIAQFEADRDELDKLTAQAAQLTEQRDKLRAERDDPGGLVTESKKVAEQTAEAKAERDRLAKQLESVQQEIKDRKGPPAPPRVVVQPGGSGVGLQPTFIECGPAEVVVHVKPTPLRIRRADLPKSDAYLKLLDRIADAEKQTVVFLLRDKGVGTYYTARNIARQRFARNGKLPIIGAGPIDLTQFERQ